MRLSIKWSATRPILWIRITVWMWLCLSMGYLWFILSWKVVRSLFWMLFGKSRNTTKKESFVGFTPAYRCLSYPMSSTLAISQLQKKISSMHSFWPSGSTARTSRLQTFLPLWSRYSLFHVPIRWSCSIRSLMMLERHLFYCGPIRCMLSKLSGKLSCVRSRAISGIRRDLVRRWPPIRWLVISCKSLQFKRPSLSWIAEI